MTATPGAVTQDPEDVFELPGQYSGAAISRQGPASDEAGPRDLPRDPQALAEYLQGRRESIEERRHLLDQTLTAPDSDPELVALMKDADFGDVASLTPLGAAVAEACLEGRWGFGGLYSITVWEGVRGVSFALEAFAEYCHLQPPTSFDRAIVRSKSAPHLFDRWRGVCLLLDRIRAAAAPARAEALRTAARLREDDPTGFRRTLTTFLFPERADWFWADVRDAGVGPVPASALLPSATTPEQAAAVGELIRQGPSWNWHGDLGIEATYLTAAGPDALPFLLAWYDGYQDPKPIAGHVPTTAVKERIIDLIARVPRDEAMRALVERVDDPGVLPRLHAATKRFPRRALRVLAEAQPGRASRRVSDLLSMVALADPGFTRAALPFLGPAAGERVEALLAREPSPADVALDQLPAILAAPPWRDRERKPVKPVVVEGLTPPAETEVCWLPGERERWLAARGAGWQPAQGWAATAEEVAAGEADDLFAVYFAAYAPEDLVRPLLAGWTPSLRRADERAYAFVARYQSLAIPAVLDVKKFPAERARLLQPFVDPEIAALMVDGMSRLRSVHALAVGWLRRHPEAAARCLLPAALGKRGRARQNAVAGLRVIEAAGTDLVAVATQTFGAGVGLAVKELMSDDGMGGYPRTMPTPPIWARAAVLPPVRVRAADGDATLPPSAVQAIVEMLAISKSGAPYPGLDIVKEFCDGASLGEFAWALFVNWEQAGTSAKEKWAFEALGLLGDDTVVDRLVPLIKAWPGQGRQQLAGDALAVLAAIGGDRALFNLRMLADKASPNALRRKARQWFEDVAESLDLSADQLADRVIPDLGLGPDGTLRLDYGPRHFDVGFDELLRPRIVDSGGKAVKTLPKPGRKDDQELATASYQEFTALKKAARTVTADQIKRMEQAMLTGRRWTPEDFASLVIPHPLLRPIARRLVWGVYADGALVGSFRVAEDLSYADVHDAHYTVPDDAVIGVVYPVDLGAALGEWSEVFADYEILQPFDQLGRPVLELTRQERISHELARFNGFPTAPALIAGLEARGWFRGPIGDGPMWSSILRPVGDERFVVAEFSPGIWEGAVTQSAYQQFTRVWLSVVGEFPEFERHSVKLSELDVVTASEILRDLGEVVPL
ncbi:MAG: DUF4132 domain-containing protein [Catenulisporales bacterium]|nr:DUF4132 domain-containing protein [Catenulisporales bacterium]